MPNKKNSTLLISTNATNSSSLLSAISGMKILQKKVLRSLTGDGEVLYLTVENDGCKPKTLDNLNFSVMVNQS